MMTDLILSAGVVLIALCAVAHLAILVIDYKIARDLARSINRKHDDA